MKNKPALESAATAGPAKPPPEFPESSEKGSETPLLTVPECDSASELAEFCDALLATFDTRPKQLRLRFIGPPQLSPDPALMLYDILTNQRNGVPLITEAWSPVLGPSILVWLTGDVRRIRPTTHFYFRSLEEIIQRRKSRRPPWENDFAALAGDAEPEVSPRTTDYATVLRLMDQYLPVEQFAGKIITPEMLQDLGLLENSPLDALLQKCLMPDNASEKNGNKKVACQRMSPATGYAAANNLVRKVKP